MATPIKPANETTFNCQNRYVDHFSRLLELLVSILECFGGELDFNSVMIAKFLFPEMSPWKYPISGPSSYMSSFNVVKTVNRGYVFICTEWSCCK